MCELSKVNLNSAETKEYFVKAMEGVNALSAEILNHIDFSKGSFFTLLPPEANMACIHHFSEGGILEQKPIQISPKGGKYQLLNSVAEEVTYYLYEWMLSYPNTSWVFDDVYAADTKKGQEFYRHYGISSLNTRGELDVCYILNKNNATLKEFEMCIEICRMPIWYFLGVLTEADFLDVVDQQMTSNKIQEIVCKAKILILNAYDREGYVFWERN